MIIEHPKESQKPPPISLSIDEDIDDESNELHTDLLIIILDNRFKYLQNIINTKSNSTLTESKLTKLLYSRKIGYNYYTFTINIMYCYQFGYSLVIVDFPLNENNIDKKKQSEKNITTLDVWSTCQSKYFIKNPNQYVPMVWCKLHVLLHYLEQDYLILDGTTIGNMKDKKYKKLYYKWIAYLDSDTHFIPFDISFPSWIQHINTKFSQTINLLQKTNNNMTQIPITFRDRKKGKSKIPRLEIIRTLKNLLLIKLGIIKK